MTSDAKIGLLLGLIFIFVIAFIINGLPRFRSVANSSELTMNMVSTPSGTLGIGANERRVQDGLDRPALTSEQSHASVQRPFEQKEDIRFRMEFPQETSLIMEPPIQEPADQADPAATASAESTASEAPAREKTEAGRSKAAVAQVYTVCDGDTLGDIAKMLYGPEEGNKRENVMRIFEANRQLLKSPDQIDVGQKLTIPPLGASEAAADKSDSVLSGSMFEKVISIGKKHLLSDSSASQSTRESKAKPAGQTSASPVKTYVVREGDCLSRIAAQQLGDANRYLEIAKLNADQLKDPDDLPVGTQLKMPAR